MPGRVRQVGLRFAPPIHAARLIEVIAEQKRLERLHADILARREQGAPVAVELEATAVRLGVLQQELLACELWRRDIEASSLVLAGGTLIVGGRRSARTRATSDENVSVVAAVAAVSALPVLACAMECC